MNNRKRTAIIKALTKAGWSEVIMTDYLEDGDLHLSGETWVEDLGMAGDYYQEFGFGNGDGISLDIDKILKKYNTYAEWWNAGVISIIAY
tara:strand:- start:422 stop:691 length:270 start_codon:yes stop_codon:yes gene_type:complete